MSHKTPALLDRLDETPVGHAPVDHLLTTGRAAMRRKRRTAIVGVAAGTALVLGGGFLATQAFPGTGGPTDSAIVSPPGRDLAVQVEAGVSHRVVDLFGEPVNREAAIWDADDQTVIYVSGLAYSPSCPPDGTAEVTDNGAVTLGLVDNTRGLRGCTAIDGRITVAINGLTDPPSELTVTGLGKTDVVPVVTGHSDAPIVGGQTQQVGIGQVVVSVPSGWASNAASCNTATRDTFFFPYGQDCIAARPPGEPSFSSVAITKGGFTETGTRLDELKPEGHVDGHVVVGNEPVCRTSRPPSCTQVFGIPDLDAYFTVHTSAPGGTSLMRGIRDSLTVLPDDQTTVPFVPNGTEADVSRALRDAGLTVEVKREACGDGGFCANGVVDVSPAGGTVVPVGSTVTVTVLGS